MPIEVDRLQCFLGHNQDHLLAQCEPNDVITGARYVYSSNIVHLGAGLGLFAAKDFKKGELIGHYFGALYLCHKGGFNQFHTFTFACNTNQKKKKKLNHPFGFQIQVPHSLAFQREPLNTSTAFLQLFSSYSLSCWIEKLPNKLYQ